MKTFSTIVAWLYGAILIAGALFSGWGIVIGIQKYNAAVLEFGDRATWMKGWAFISDIGDGIALLLLTLAYGLVLLRRRGSWASPLAYLLSYGMCGIAFLVTLESAWKGDSPDETRGILVGLGTMLVLPAVIASGVLLYFSTRPAEPA